MPVSDNSTTASNAAGKVAKIVFLSLFALVLVVVSVSFAVHHMRLGFEKEFQNTLIRRVQSQSMLQLRFQVKRSRRILPRLHRSTAPSFLI